jgi:hypothetical protein
MYNEIYKKFHEALKIQSGGDENQGIYFMWPNSTNTKLYKIVYFA